MKLILRPLMPAGIVDLLEVSRFGLVDHAVGGSRSAVRHDVADLDFGIGSTGVVFFLSERAAARRREDNERSRCNRESAGSKRHSGSPFFNACACATFFC